MASFPKPDDLSSTTRGKYKYQEAKGKITEDIGEGDNAKNSIVFIVLERCFIIAGIITFGLFLYNVFLSCEKQELVKDIISIWEIFVPVITLALGYVFGKGK